MLSRVAYIYRHRIHTCHFCSVFFMSGKALSKGVKKAGNSQMATKADDKKRRKSRKQSFKRKFTLTQHKPQGGVGHGEFHE
ncbi:hypothetical protein M513_11443 [Trichuris suis]|uniref:Uncharacterized protein n=1 Tax=Trichuris suis TaxID=68888 RepID=A0A085LRQ6_9BILA|nr:hypothetical protein M513_11443 [Trichuris suis]